MKRLPEWFPADILESPVAPLLVGLEMVSRFGDRVPCPIAMVTGELCPSTMPCECNGEPKRRPTHADE